MIMQTAFENLKTSFSFAQNNLVGKWINWLILIILTAIPILNFFTFGYVIRIFRGIEPTLDNWKDLFLDGLIMFLITLAYLIIPAVVLYVGITMFMPLIWVAILLIILIALMLPIAWIMFAKSEYVADAFKFKEIIRKINEITWWRYLTSIILLGIVIGCISFIIAYIATYLSIYIGVGVLLPILFTPFFTIWQAKFYENLYSLN